MFGEVTEDKLEIVRESDAILRDEIAKQGLKKFGNTSPFCQVSVQLVSWVMVVLMTTRLLFVPSRRLMA